MIKEKTIGLIAAVDVSGILGYDNSIPWKCSADIKRFKQLTMGHTLIMGRKTYESLPPKGLPGRTIHVLHRTKSQLDNTESVVHFDNLITAIENSPTDLVWIAGGAQIYQESLMLKIPDFIDLSIINSSTIKDNLDIQLEKIVKMPTIPYSYRVKSETINPDDTKLWHRKYVIREEAV